VAELATNTSISFKTHEDDFLQYHLFDAATNGSEQKKGGISYLWVIITLACLGFLAYQKVNSIPFSNLEFILIAVCLCMYPVFKRWNYKNQYRKFIRKTYKNSLGKLYTIHFNNDFIGLLDDSGEAKIKFAEVAEVVETLNYYFLKLKTAHSIIIPKNELENIDALRKELIEVAGKANAKFIYDSNWR